MVVVIGSIYAIPNLYPTQPSIQVAYTDSGKSADQALLNELENILKKASEDDIKNKPSYIEADEETKATIDGFVSPNEGLADKVNEMIVKTSELSDDDIPFWCK